MRSKHAFSNAEQLALRFSRAEGLPYAVSQRLQQAGGIRLVRALRRKQRVAQRQCGNAAAYAASPEGRRAHAALDGLVIALCG